MDGPPDWDLLAVVRSCSSTTTTATTTTTTTTTPPSDLHQPPPPPPCSSSSSPLLHQIQQEQLCFSPPTPSSCSSSSVLFGFSSPLNTTSFLNGGGGGGQQELQDICKPMMCTTSPTSYNNNNNNMECSNNNFQALSCSSLTSPVSSSSSIITAGRSFTMANQHHHHHQQQQQSHLRRVVKPSQVIFGASSTSVTTAASVGSTSQNQRTKKRKNLMKKVCHVPAEGLSSDMWAWRKYGQKPIKGSPYPRGYYRCSSSKGCLARKQVERNRSDPKMFIVTYTSEHNHPMPTHRNSLAGSTRQKPLTTSGTPPEQPTCSSPSAACLSPLTERSGSKTEGEDMNKDEEDTDMGGLSDLMLNDDFYVGFEQIDGGSDDSDCFSEHFSPSSEFPWLVNGSTTATAAGGS